MIAEWIKEIPNWESQYKEMMSGKLSKRQVELLDGAILDYMGLKDPNKPHYGEIQPEPGREEYLNQIEKNKKQFEMVDLVSPSWTIQVPRRKK